MDFTELTHDLTNSAAFLGPAAVVCGSVHALHNVARPETTGNDAGSFRPLRNYVSRPVEAVLYGALLVFSFACAVRTAKNL